MAADGRHVNVIVDVIAGGKGTSAVKSSMREVSEEARRINRETEQQAKQTQKVVAEATRQRVNDQLREERRLERERRAIANDFLKTLSDLETKQTKGVTTGSIFAGTFIGTAATAALVTATSALQSGARAWLDYASKLEQARIGMTTMTGSAAIANKHLKDLQDFAKTTPFEFGDLVTASQRMQGVGIEAGRVIPLLKDVGNALAAAGRIEDLPFAIKALGDIQAKGKLAGQEIIQLANAGIPAIQMLSQHLKKTSGEVLKMGEQGQISAEMLFAALHKISTEKFGNAMEQQSKTFLGAMSNIKDALLITASTAFQPLYDRISRLAVDFGTEISRQGKDLEAVGEVIAKYMGRGIEAGTEVSMQALGGIIAKRIEQIFGPGSGIFDPLSNAVMLGIVRGFTRGFAQFSNELAKQPWYVRMLFGGTTGLMAPSNVTIPSSGGSPSPSSYTRTMPGTSGFRLNLKPSSGSSIFLGGGGGLFSGQAPNTPFPGLVPLTGETPKTTPPGGGGGGGRRAITGTGSTAPGNGLSANARTIIAAAQAIGVSPLDYATFLLYEGAGSLSTSRWGGKNNAYLGPMQMGPEERAMYGRKAGVGTVKPGMSLENYLKAANAYLTGRGVKPGMGLPELYTAINYGNVFGGVQLGAKDQNGTVREHLTRMIRDRRPQAQALLKGYSGGGGGNIGDDVGRMLRDQSDALTAADKQRHLLAIINLYKTLGIIPTGETLKEIHAMMLEEARNSGVSTFGMSPEKTAVGFMKQFAPTLSYKGQAVKRDASGRLVAVDDGTIAMPTTGVSTNVSLRAMELSPGEAYIRNLRISLGLAREANGEMTRGAQLLMRKEQIEAEIAARLEDQRMTRKETLHDLESEYQLLLKRNVAEDGQITRLRDRNQLTREIQDMRDEIANGGANDGLIIQAAHLRDILDLRNRERDAVIAINRAQLELSKSMEISNNQIRAGVYSHLAAQKTLNQAIADGINQTHDAILQRMNAPLDKLNDKAKGMLSFITEPLKAMQANMLGRVTRSLVDVIFPGDSPIKDALKSTGNPVLDEAIKQTDYLKRIEMNTRGGQGANGGLPGLLSGLPGLGGGKGAGTAGNLLNILLGGKGMGPGGTPPFNPNTGAGTAGNLLNILTGGGGGGAASGTATGGRGNTAGNLLNILTGQGGGIGGIGGIGGKAGGGWKGIFGKGGMFGKEGFGFNAGTGAGLGSIAMMAGSMIGGRMGNVLSMAGMGAQIGSLFGPWGSVIGAVGGAIIGLFTGGDNATKKLKEAAAAEFGISVKDKKVLKQLKAVGEGMFGKGKAGENARAVVRSEQGQNILRAYAESTGQSSLKIDRLNYGDPNWEGNNFRSQFGGFGSPTSSVAGSASMEASRFGGYRASGGSVRAGYSYVVGERGPETVMFTRDATVGANAGNAAFDTKQMQAVMTATLRTLDRMADALDSFESMPVDEVVRRGAHGASRQIADAADRDFADDARRSERLYRNIGAMV